MPGFRRLFCCCFPGDPIGLKLIPGGRGKNKDKGSNVEDPNDPNWNEVKEDEQDRHGQPKAVRKPDVVPEASNNNTPKDEPRSPPLQGSSENDITPETASSVQSSANVVDSDSPSKPASTIKVQNEDGITAGPISESGGHLPDLSIPKQVEGSAVKPENHGDAESVHLHHVEQSPRESSGAHYFSEALVNRDESVEPDDMGDLPDVDRIKKMQSMRVKVKTRPLSVLSAAGDYEKFVEKTTTATIQLSPSYPEADLSHKEDEHITSKAMGDVTKHKKTGTRSLFVIKKKSSEDTDSSADHEHTEKTDKVLLVKSKVKKSKSKSGSSSSSSSSSSGGDEQ